MNIYFACVSLPSSEFYFPYHCKIIFFFSIVQIFGHIMDKKHGGNIPFNNNIAKNCALLTIKYQHITKNAVVK